MEDSEYITQEIKTLLGYMGFDAHLEAINVHQGVTTRFSVRLRHAELLPSSFFEEVPVAERHDDAVSMLIGERGLNLAAFEHLVKKIIKKKYHADHQFTIDINEYRMKRLEGLKQDVKTAAKEVRLYQKEVPLRPMSSFERRVVHLLLAEYPDITTESMGVEPDRRVVIKPYP